MSDPHPPPVPPSPTRRIPRVLWLIIGLYAVAHVLPVTMIFDSWVWGWQASLAPLELFVDGLRHRHFDSQTVRILAGWLPNPLLWLGIASVIVGRRRSVRWAGIGTGVAGLAAFACAGIWFLDRGPNDDLAAGYYAWIASMLFLSAYGFWMAARSTSRTTTRRVADD
jgi:hypothetical protein